MRTDCIVTWAGGSQTIKGARLGDERISDLLDRLAHLHAQRVRMSFVDTSPEPQEADRG